MRRPHVLLAVLNALAATLVSAWAQTEAEFRGATTEYRYAELSHAFPAGLVFDGVYFGEPGIDELYLGAGFDLSSSSRASLIPILYAVVERDNAERGMTLGLSAHFEGDRWQFAGFAGHFIPHGGDGDAYTFLDSLDLVRSIGHWGAGGSVTYDGLEDSGGWRAGPMLKHADDLGAWAASVRFGDGAELRVIRTLRLSPPARELQSTSRGAPE